MKNNAFAQRTRRDGKHPKELVALFKTLCCAVLVFIVCWAPYAFISIFTLINGSNNFSDSLNLVAEMIAKASVVYNPLVLVTMNGQFRRTVCKFLCTDCITETGNNKPSTSSLRQKCVTEMMMRDNGGRNAAVVV